MRLAKGYRQSNLFTDEELRIINCIERGMVMKQICYALDKSRATVRVQLLAICRVLELPEDDVFNAVVDWVDSWKDEE